MGRLTVIRLISDERSAHGKPACVKLRIRTATMAGLYRSRARIKSSTPLPPLEMLAVIWPQATVDEGRVVAEDQRLGESTAFLFDTWIY